MFLYTIYYKTFNDMGKLFKLTEEQYREVLKEWGYDGVNGSLPTSQTHNGKQKINTTIKVPKNNPQSAGEQYKQKMKEFQTNGVDPSQVNVNIETESYIISKKELSENRQKKLKKFSKTYTVTDFLNQINK